ncbi:Longitudinals lacking protein, isoform G [Gryllus bimaculatus]|nr:Longitudinals lacking protein, isoform G [Gryllus bimaculatus]
MCSMVSGNNSFHLEWSNHLGNMQAVLETLYINQSLVDVTIACRDGVLKAHKVILSACSPYFEAVFRETPCKHPVLILKGVNVHEMQALLRFMYRGQVDVPEAELSAVIATACEFKVKGFSVDGIPGGDEYRPDSASEHESEIETPVENVQPRVTIHNWKDDKKAEHTAKASDKLSGMTDEIDVTPVIVDSQSLQKTPAEDTPEKDENKEQEEADEEEAVREEVDKKPDAEELAASLKASKVAQPDVGESALPSSNTNTEANTNVSGSTASNTANAVCAPVASGPSGSSSSTSNSNSPAVTSSASANNGDATPYRRETRYKGQKRVDVGIRPAAGRARIVDKRESSGGESRSSAGYGSSHSTKKPRVTAPSRKSDFAAVPEHSLPSVDRMEDKKLILESSAVDISITRAGSSLLEDGSPSFVKIKAEAESADEDEDDDEATADMFCIPHLQELPDTDGGDPSVSGEVDIAPRWNMHAPPLSSSGREQRTVVEAPAEEGEGDMACPYCFTRCPRFSDLKRHMRLHTEDKPHECEFCSLAFARASHLARHRRTHTGERPFRCPAPSCERTFSRQDKLKLHTQRAHPGLPCDLVQSGTFMRIRGRRRIRDKNLPLGLRLGIAPSLQPANLSGGLSAASSSQSAAPVGPAVISLPFGDTSYLTSLSLGQQRYSDLTISPVTASSSGTSSSGGGTGSGTGAEELLKSVRQLGECTIQTLPSKVLAE